MPTISHVKSNEAVGTALQWLQAEGTDSSLLLLVKNWMRIAAGKGNNTLTQTTIPSYSRLVLPSVKGISQFYCITQLHDLMLLIIYFYFRDICELRTLEFWL